MNIHELFSRMDEELGRRWAQAQSTEERELLRTVMDARDFIAAAGQLYAFEDFREHHPPGRPSEGKVAELLTRLRDSAHSAEEKSVLQGVMDALHFVEETGQSPALEDYLMRRREGAPPRVMASFKSREEAEDWLLKHPAPPSSALVLIAGQFHQVFCFRELNHRKLQPWPAMEYYLADLRQAEPIVPVASFGTREEAEAWLHAHPEPPERAWVSIAGEPYLAVHHSNVHHRALYPLSMADGYEVNYEVEA
ncbi:MAG TPA: hypothetical protein VK539_23840 [Myxococcaceae bacterium]|nr:hypothetical protein [Myxococcaceae bacterium]